MGAFSGNRKQLAAALCGVVSLLLLAVASTETQAAWPARSLSAASHFEQRAPRFTDPYVSSLWGALRARQFSLWGDPYGRIRKLALESADIPSSQPEAYVVDPVGGETARAPLLI